MEKYVVINEHNYTKQDMSNVDLTLVKQIDGVPYLDIIQYPGCNIVLFGDVHQLTEEGFGTGGYDSLYLPLYLDALFKKYPQKQFDLMIESGYVKVNNFHMGELETVLANIELQFEPCYTNVYNKKECNNQWPNVRFHSLDIRTGGLNIYKSQNAINESHAKLQKIIDNIGPWIGQFYQISAEFEEMILNCIMKHNDDKGREECFKYEILQNLYVKFGRYKIGELGITIFNKLESENSKFIKYKELSDYENIKKFIIHEMEISNQIYNPRKLIIELLKKDRNPKLIEIQNIVNIISALILKIGSSIFDYYTLIRINKVKKYGGKNIIMVAGRNHTDVIRNYVAYAYDSYRHIFSNGYIKIDNNIFEHIIHEYETIFKPKFSLLHFNMTTSRILDYLNVLQREIIKSDKSNSRIRNLLININTLIKMCQIIETSRNEVCNMPTPYLNNIVKLQRRTIRIPSSLIENSLS